MGGASAVTVDLGSLTLRSGEAARLDLVLRPAAPVVAGETLTLGRETVDARLDISRTTSGFAMRLRAEVPVEGICARCLEPARLSVSLDVREVEQGASRDSELRSPYVTDDVLDVSSWARDALRLALPERLLCRPDCAGLCEVCGASLNEVDPAEHHHDRPRDPRFARLGELLE
jgi:uncharacterized protein